MSTTLSTEAFNLTKVTILPDLTPDQIAIASINDDPDDFMKGMIIYKIEPLPTPERGASSSLKYELKFSLRTQVPGVWLADFKDGDSFAAGIPHGVKCPIRTQLGRYLVTRLEKEERSEEGVKDKVAKVFGVVYAGSKHAVTDLRDSVAFGCGLKRVREIEMVDGER